MKAFDSTPITEYISKNKMSKNDFCKFCEITSSTLNKILVGDASLKFTCLLKISTKINVPLSAFFKK